jgi:non-specific serine/threonine protein kinase/serine/threonine-protein kinase
MTPERWEQIRDVLDGALNLAPDERSAFLDRACSSDPSLRNEVEVLLAQNAHVPSDFLQSSAMAEFIGAEMDDIDSSAATLKEGQEFAQRFRLIRQLGEGGMGQVWLAEQTFPVRRQVALKMIKAGMYDEAVVERFQSERQSLAIMDHPAIAKVFDAGTTPQGQPYFVMEYVPGLPITEYCDQKKLAISNRLELFIETCEGVQHAHQKAIIHRDLKPANILVVEVDGKPVPRIIDFGLAKAATQPIAGNARKTQLGNLVGTPGYMSPEQADANVLDIDTRTDVYSLGVVLYVLLSGREPFESKQGQKQPLDELLRRLREDEPPRPSTKVSSDRHSLDAIAAARSIEPGQLTRVLRGDLDWITMKALEKDRSRRYGAPSDLAADIRRYLDHEPVLARPASAAYRSGKFVKRHKFALAVASVFALMVLAGAVAIVREAQIARMQAARAERRFNDVRTLANSLLFDVYDSIQDLPGSTPARRIVADRALHYLDTLSQESAGSPDLERELATAYERVGDVQGNPYFPNLGDTAGAIQSYRKALRIRLDLAGEHPRAFPDQAALVATYMNLGPALENNLDFTAAMDTYRKAYAVATTWAADRKDDPQAQETLAGVCFSLAILLADQGDVAGSLNYYRKSAAIREAIRGGSTALRDQVQTRLAGVYGYMAGDLSLQGDFASAIALQSKAHAILAAQLAADSQNSQLREFLLQSEYWAAKYSEQKGDYRQAISNYREAFAGYQKLNAADPRDALAMRYLGLCEMGMGNSLASSGNVDQGIQHGRQAVQIFAALTSAGRGSTSVSILALAHSQSALANDFMRLAARPASAESDSIANWRTARYWFQQSLNQLQTLKQRNLLAPYDLSEPDRVAREVANCDANLKRFARQ